ncbi:hypothetical protein M408DRAFT_326542 [Serendipita vermifera MAFF 305830]|uniref:Cryptic loci regulator 2 N-terminal domain-containing protein n=1 Tax=Serendipita vermifera MAFF 305830 TaxID=933852 RepID=A0A0C3BL66_SERVB|nr:hypothetical protein M408DRAFT_186885 [Serendipita vermifera MAFF 305830]KIM32811.1 hypothetical protein M408DRAFT_326542 [Serendipita vermifera MAFF 305830]
MSYQGTSQSREPRFTGNNFIFEGALLTINVTDSEETRLPPESIKVTDKGTVQRYHKEGITSPTSKHWRSLIAQELCIKYLGYPHGRDYILTAFPSGYHLYTCREGSNATSKASRDDIRRDAYLHGGGHKFRSPAEAFCHFAWLMRGKPPNRCKCVYDTSLKRFRRSQGALNADLKKRYTDYMDQKRKQIYRDKMECIRNGKEYITPPPPVDSFNDDTYLLPASKPRASRNR